MPTVRLVPRLILLAFAVHASTFCVNAHLQDIASLSVTNNCAVGDRLLIHIDGEDDYSRRITMQAIQRRQGYESLHIPKPGEPTPRWIEWRNGGASIKDIPRVSTRSNSGTFLETAVLRPQDSVRAPWDRRPEELSNQWMRYSTVEYRGTRNSVSNLVESRFSGSVWNANVLAWIGAEKVHVEPDPTVRIAILDNGVAAHPFLADSLSCAGGPPREGCEATGRMVSADSDLDSDSKVETDACYGGHATWMAGAITAQHDQDRIGIFPGVKIDSWSAARTCSGMTDGVCSSGLQWLATFAAAAKQASVINFSYKPHCGNETAVSLFHDAMVKTSAAVVVMGAYNSQTDMDRSARCVKALLDLPNILVVTWMHDASRVGGAFGNQTVSLGVPLEDMCTTDDKEANVDGCPLRKSGYGFIKVGQSSIATAVVSAAAAMVLSDPRYRTCKASQVVEILLKQAIPHPQLKGGVLSLKFLEDDAPLVDVACARPRPAAIAPSGTPSRN